MAEEFVRSVDADGVLWCGVHDALIRLHVVRPVSRDWLDAEAARLLQVLRSSPGFSGGPDHAEVDCDEETAFDANAPAPGFRKIILSQSSGQTVGGFLLFSGDRKGCSDDLLEGAADAFAAAFLLSRLQQRLDDASDRLKEIAEVGRIFAQVGEPERTLSRILDLAIQSSSAQIGALVHYDRDGRLAALGMKIEHLRRLKFAGGEDVVERAAGSQKEAVYGRGRLRSELQEESPGGTVETLVTFPLLHEGRSRGALVLVNVPEHRLSDEPLVAMLSTIARLAAAAITAEDRQRERLEQEKTRQELRAARTIQQSLMPRALPEARGLRMAALWKPSRTLGGDFYDIFPMAGGRLLGVVIADVSGKGLPAALLMAVTRSYLRVLADAGRPPNEVLAGVNARLAGEIADNRFVTATYMVIDLETRECVLANAGHHAPALVDASGKLTLLDAEGLPLGIFAETAYAAVTHRVQPGSTLLLYTDGLPETRNRAGVLLGQDGLLEVFTSGVAAEPSAQLDRLWNATVAYGDQHEPLDDWTAVVIGFRD